MSKHAWFMAVVAAAVVSSAEARAADTAPKDVDAAGERTTDARDEAPIVAYSYSATGASARTVGAEAYGLGTSGGAGQKAVLGGGVTVWGAPIDRLTLIGDATRDVFGNFAPSAAAVVRILGEPGRGASFGALAKFKVEGFGVGPDDEVESEIEIGALFSYTQRALHLDVNAIAGRGTGDDGEMDAEARLRAAYDLSDLVRAGLDGQARFRLDGDTKLPGGRTWDFAGGPQLLVGSHHFFGALTTGPTTMGVASGLAWTAIASIGGVAP